MINATLLEIAPSFTAMVDIEGDKVVDILAALHRGERLPPPIVVDLGGHYIPIDGHHRMQAHKILGRNLTAWVVDEEAFEDLDRECRDNDTGRAEDHIYCGGVRVYDVAGNAK